jgi:hypothetical protein
METTNLNEREKEIWKQARNRVKFKQQLVIYLIVNLILWITWLLTMRFDSEENTGYTIPWPVFPTIGWGIGILMQYFYAYKYNQYNAIEKEFEKLKSK